MPLPALLMPSILTGLGGLAGLFGRPQNQESTNYQSGQQTQEGYANQTGNSNTQSIIESLQRMMGRTSSTSTPTMSPEATRFMNQLISQYSTLSRPVNLSGYQAQQGGLINQNSALQQQAAQQMMASRGLASSPVSATTGANIDAQRFAQQGQLAQSLPLVQNQLQQQNLGSAASFFSALPRGVTSTSDTTQDTIGSQKVDSNTAMANQSNMWGTNYGGTSSRSTGSGSQGGGVGGLAGGLGSILAALFGGGSPGFGIPKTGNGGMD